MAQAHLYGQGAAVFSGTRTIQIGSGVSSQDAFTSPSTDDEKTVFTPTTAFSQVFAAFNVSAYDIHYPDMASRGEHLFGSISRNNCSETDWVGQDLRSTTFFIRQNGTAAWEEPANWSLDRWGVSYLDQENPSWISTNGSQAHTTLSAYDQFGTPTSGDRPLWGNWYVVPADPVPYTTLYLPAPIKTIELTGASTTTTALTGTRTAAATMTGVQTITATLTGDAGKAE